MLRLLISGERIRKTRAPTYAAHLDGEFIVRSSQPLYDGARCCWHAAMIPTRF